MGLRHRIERIRVEKENLKMIQELEYLEEKTRRMIVRIALRKMSGCDI